MTAWVQPDPLRKNIRFLYADIAWFGVLSGSAMAFLNIYAARLGANAAEIGWLTAGPAIINLMVSLPSGHWLEGRSFSGTATWSSLYQRLGYVAMIFVPWLFVGHVQVTALVAITLLMALPQTFLAISFNALFAQAVPPELRSEVVGKRNALLAITQTAATLISGQALDVLAFPYNYALVFGVGSVGAMLSTYYLSKVRVPTLPGAHLPGTGFRLSESLRTVFNPRLLQGGFGRFMIAYWLFYTFQYLLLPLFPLRMVNTLQLSDGMISLGNGLFYATMFLISLRLGHMARRFNHHRLLYASAAGLALYPVLLGLARGVPLYLVASLVGGVVWGVLNASLINRLIERVPDDQRPAGMALHNLVLNLGILIGSLLAPVFNNAFGLDDAIFIGAGLRLLAGILLIYWG
jgi:MFS family permease